jgi:hypothetical protein
MSGLLLGPNEEYEDFFYSASERTDIGPEALAAFAEMEAAKEGKNDPMPGRWRADSRNKNAAGLMQFMGPTWLEMATREGTYLNSLAQSKGWLDADGRIIPEMQAALLDQRFDPRTSIETAADYAKKNIDELRRKGFVNGILRTDEQAYLAYLAHHEGVQGAIWVLDPNGQKGYGVYPEAKAEANLAANIGSGGKSDARIKQFGGSARHAYLDWVINDLMPRVDIDKFHR